MEEPLAKQETDAYHRGIGILCRIPVALIMRSFQLGTYQKLYRDVIESYSGYLQLAEL